MGLNRQVLKTVEFNGFSDWFVNYNPVQEFWDLQPTYIIAQCSFLISGLCTLIHALCNGKRLPYLWLGTILHGLVVESICYILPDVDNFWHSQTPLIFFGRRLPLHIIFLYPCFIYQASIAVTNMKLPKWAEPFAVGLVVVLIDIPYDITSVKFVHWTWHDTDPNIADRHYWVPWNSYYFHCTFAASFTFWFHNTHCWMSRSKSNVKWTKSSLAVEVGSMLIASLLGPIGGILLFLPIYHPLHDFAKIHSEVTFFILFTIALVIVWSADRQPKPELRTQNFRWKWILIPALVIHYCVFLGMVIWGNPEKEISIGLHEPTGPCNTVVPVQTAFGNVLEKRAYLCVTDYNEDYFDFSCTRESAPKGIARWYTICGNKFENRIEYITVICTVTFLAITVFWNLHFRKLVTNPSTNTKQQVVKKKQ